MFLNLLFRRYPVFNTSNLPGAGTETGTVTLPALVPVLTGIYKIKTRDAPDTDFAGYRYRIRPF
jgi:hypothetical protein